jgi:hypothetical protein
MRVAHGQDGDPVLSGRNTTEQFSIDVPAPGKLTIESIEQGTGGKSTMELSGERLPPS